MNYINSNDLNIQKNEKKVWIALAPDYANMGDVAAQKTILEKAYPNRTLVEFPMFDFFKYKDKIKKLINDEDIITIIGGGNMGNVYLAWEERRRDLISSFPNNKIISFPQSIDFEDNDIGKKEFQNTINLYGNHKDLTIFSREQKSYNIMKENFANEVKLVPDTVLYLANIIKPNKNIKREKVLLCFRDDLEKLQLKV